MASVNYSFSINRKKKKISMWFFLRCLMGVLVFIHDEYGFVLNVFYSENLLHSGCFDNQDIIMESVLSKVFIC